jgi:hypothetical protein
MMIYRRSALATLAAILNAATLATASAQDPQAVLNGLIQQQTQEYQASHDNRMMQMQLDRQELAEKLRFRRATNLQIMQELDLYCPSGNPPCPSPPPQSLLQEAARRGLITMASRPSQEEARDCLIFGDGEGGGIADCQ